MEFALSPLLVLALSLVPALTTGTLHAGNGAPRSGLEGRPQPVSVAADPRAASPVVAIPFAKKGRFAKSVPLGDGSLVLNGAGLCEWGILGINLYHAALYLERTPKSRAEILKADQVALVHLQFCRKLTEAQLREAYDASVRVNTGDAFDAYAEPLDRFLDMLEAVSAGDTYTFISRPGEGLLVQRGGELVGRIADEDFRRLFLRLYLGDKPPTKALRKGLLGGLK